MFASSRKVFLRTHNARRYSLLSLVHQIVFLITGSLQHRYCQLKGNTSEDPKFLLVRDCWHPHPYQHEEADKEAKHEAPHKISIRSNGRRRHVVAHRRPIILYTIVQTRSCQINSEFRSRPLRLHPCIFIVPSPSSFVCVVQLLRSLWIAPRPAVHVWCKVCTDRPYLRWS